MATSQALAMYGLGLPGMALTTVLMRALYARSLPREALRVTLSTVGANLVFCLLLMGPLSYRGIALASSLAFSGSALVGYHRLGRNLKRPLGLFRDRWLFKPLMGLVALVVVVSLVKLLLPYGPTARLALRAAWVLGVTAAGGGAYGLVTAALRCQEWNWLINACRKDGSS
jgi:putative peptidoglycan lipid II flippase